MANYFWLPYYDKTWDAFLNLRTGVNERAKILPYANGSYAISGFSDGKLKEYAPAPWNEGKWNDLVDGDRLQIATHGRKYTTTNVAWDSPGGIVTWTAEQMAFVLKGFVKARTIQFELLACFGANGWGPVSSFGEKLAAEMRKQQIRGSLTALRGATNIGKGQGHQTGKSRITAGLYIFRKGGSDPEGRLTTESKVTWTLYEQ